MGTTLGEETHLLSTPEIPAHNHGVTDPGHTHSGVQPGGGATGSSGTGGAAVFYIDVNGSTASATTGISINNAGGGGTHNNMQPSSFMNAIVKL
jgi:microcystin-dependent protein